MFVHSFYSARRRVLLFEKTEKLLIVDNIFIYSYKYCGHNSSSGRQLSRPNNCQCSTGNSNSFCNMDRTNGNRWIWRADTNDQKSCSRDGVCCGCYHSSLSLSWCSWQWCWVCLHHHWYGLVYWLDIVEYDVKFCFLQSLVYISLMHAMVKYFGELLSMCSVHLEYGYWHVVTGMYVCWCTMLHQKIEVSYWP